MPQSETQQIDPSNDLKAPETESISETLFLLSICRDEDDAAALRADLARSGLGSYKIQRCVHLDDAIQLMQVCGFDLAFIRLDDFQDRQAAVDMVRQNDPNLPIVSLASNRLLKSEGFKMPQGIDGNCRIEDISPTLVTNLVSTLLEQKRGRQERIRLKQELSFAIEVGELGSWELDIETGRISLNTQAAACIGATPPEQIPYLDDFLEKAYPTDQDRLKRLFDLSIESQGDLDASFHINANGQEGPSVRISATYRPGGPREHATLNGFIKRESQSGEEIQARIEAANQAIQKALTLRDDAVTTASKELELLMQKFNSLQATPAAQAQAQPAPPETPIETPQPREQPLQKIKQPETPPPPAKPVAATPDADQTLAIDKSVALQQVLKSITRQTEDHPDNTFPFDFSTEQPSNYTEPCPHRDGFIGASKRLIDITQNGHDLSVTLSVENDGAIESERERDLLFEILKELLTNVVKHARASECIIALFRDQDDWVLQVEDDGVGLENNLVSISTPLNKIGLFRIRTKLALKGGQLDLTPTFPKGLIARARLPVCLVNRDAERA